MAGSETHISVAPTGGAATAKWLVPALLYVIIVGATGVTSKLAFRSLHWEDLLLWTGAVSLVVVAVLVGRGYARPSRSPGTGWAVVSGIVAVGGFVSFSVALEAGEASIVVPISAAYPAATLVLSAIFLGERMSVARLFGMVLVIGGAILVTAG